MASQAAFDLDKATALETAAAVRRGAISALEACDAAIARIEARDGPINAVVVRDFDRARDAARALDAGRRPDDARTLLGVPMTVKESNDIAGLPSTWGLPSFKGMPVRRDGVAVARLKAAGAVILGKSNIPTTLSDWQAVNPIYGRTVNPFDRTRTPGGSSGGGAAALAAGMVPLELGSDLGGSIRIPAHFCGVYGHKPTYGIVPLKGQNFPGTDGVEIPLAVLGPLARRAADLEVALDAIAGSEDGSAWRLDLPAALHRHLSQFRVMVLDKHPLARADGTLRGAIATLAEALEQAGAQVVRDTPSVPDLAANQAAFGQMIQAIVTRGIPGTETISAHDWMNVLDQQMRVRRQWRSVFEAVDVVLAPPFGVAAFPHLDQPDWSKRSLSIDGEAAPYGVQVAWSAIATFPGLPSTVAPIGRTAEGLPIGVQIIGAPFGDRTTIGFAELLSREGLTIDL